MTRIQSASVMSGDSASWPFFSWEIGGCLSLRDEFPSPRSPRSTSSMWGAEMMPFFVQGIDLDLTCHRKGRTPYSLNCLGFSGITGLQQVTLQGTTWHFFRLSDTALSGGMGQLTLSTLCNLKPPGKRHSVRDCLPWVGLWTCLCSLVLAGVGRPGPLWVTLFPRQGVLNGTKADTDAGTSKWVHENPFLPAPDCRCDRSGCWNTCCSFPTMTTA